MKADAARPNSPKQDANQNLQQRMQLEVAKISYCTPEMVDQRIENVLDQIQTVMTQLENQLFSRVSKIESNIGDLTQGMNSLIEDSEIASNAQTLATEAIESIRKIEGQIEQQEIVTSENFSEQIESLQSHIDKGI